MMRRWVGWMGAATLGEPLEKTATQLSNLAMFRFRSVLPGFVGWMTFVSGAVAESPKFEEAGVAFLEQHCVSCHGADKQRAGLRLDAFRDELSILRAKRRWKKVLNMVQAEDMPPEDEKQPSAEERKQFLAAVTGVFARADNAPPDPGRLTLRRLNRTEYNTTIRALLKVDFRPADDFPRDDVGYGFDNISEVLSVSPILMERYLDAADKVAELAIPLRAAEPPKRHLRALYCEPSSPDTPQDLFRPLCASNKVAILSGPLNTPARIAPDGDYVMRIRLYATSPSNKPVRLALLVTGPEIEKPSPQSELDQLDALQPWIVNPGRILKVVEVTAREEKNAQVLEAKIPPTKGIERIVFAPLKPAPGEPAPTLHVEWVEYEGPLDARSEATKSLLVFTPDKPPREQAAEVVWRFASRAWRRPVAQEELDRLMHVVDVASGHGDTWEESVRRAISAVLASPKFVFRLEPDDEPANPDAHPIGQFQLATRLSYFLWSCGPDEELMQLAFEKKLSANLEGQIRRMLKDPRADALVDNFALQWLQLGRLETHSADGKTFPRWKPELRAAMLEETRRFVREIFREDRSVLELLDADFTWVNRPLAQLYELPGAGDFKGDEWRRVSLAGTPRGGLLTQASVLTVTSNPTRTSPVKRGKWVLEQLLGTPPPPAPPNVPSLDDTQRRGLTGTFRQKLEQHRTDPNCAGCHAKMDTYGFTLENFDAIGRWRDRDETGAPVDASGKLSGSTTLQGVADLKKFFREQRGDFARCFIEKLMTYALGRGLDYYDDPALERIQAATSGQQFRFSAVVTEIVKSVPFRLRRGTAQIEPATTAAR